MKEVNWLKSLDRSSLDRHDAPSIDVTLSVMHAIRSSRNDDVEVVFPLAAVLAVIAAAVAIGLTLPIWFGAAPQDPLAGFADALNLVLQ
jgi:hypothetical protein